MNVIMFSGQGAQKLGMGKELYGEFAVYRRVFEEASDALGMDVAKLCFEEKELLAQTEYAQSALVTTGVAGYRLLEEQGFEVAVLFGLSLGEYTALAAAGVFEFETAVRLVRERGKIMARLGTAGGMLACMGLEKSVVEDICQSVQDIGFVAPANFNTPEQIVISGEKEALAACAPKIKEAGGKSMPLKVAGAFHTPMMAAAVAEFAKVLKDFPVKAGNAPVISNVTADIFDTSQYADILSKHMLSPVRFVECVQKAAGMGGKTFVELGSGNTLVSFVNKIDSGLKAFAVESLSDLEEIK